MSPIMLILLHLIQLLHHLIQLLHHHHHHHPRRYPIGVLCKIGYHKVVIFRHHHPAWAYCLRNRH